MTMALLEGVGGKRRSLTCRTTAGEMICKLTGGKRRKGAAKKSRAGKTTRTTGKRRTPYQSCKSAEMKRLLRAGSGFKTAVKQAHTKCKGKAKGKTRKAGRKGKK